MYNGGPHVVSISIQAEGFVSFAQTPNRRFKTPRLRAQQIMVRESDPQPSDRVCDARANVLQTCLTRTSLRVVVTNARSCSTVYVWKA